MNYLFSEYIGEFMDVYLDDITTYSEARTLGSRCVGNR